MKEREWDELLQALRAAGDVDRAVAAAKRLQRAVTSADVPGLLGTMKEKDFLGREAAAWPLGELGGPAVLPELLAAFQRGLDQGHEDDGFRATLIDKVEANRPAAREVRGRLARADDAAMRDNGTWLLEFCGEAGGA